MTVSSGTESDPSGSPPSELEPPAEPEPPAGLESRTLSALDQRQPGFDSFRPRDIPARGWQQILVRVWHANQKDRLPLVAAGLSFYALLGVFPALAVVVALYGLILDPTDIRTQTQALVAIVPVDVHLAIDKQLETLNEDPAELGFGLIFSSLILLWTSSSGTKHLIGAINLAYDETESRGFFRLRLLSMGLTFGAVVFLTVTVAMLSLVPAKLSRLGLGFGAVELLPILRWPFLAAAVVAALACVYRFAPDRADARWRWVSWGSIIAAGLWLSGSALFATYVSFYSSYHETYGALGAVVVLLLWFFLGAWAILLGAEINAAMELQTIRDSTTGPAQPLGQRGAEVADTLPQRSSQNARQTEPDPEAEERATP